MTTEWQPRTRQEMADDMEAAGEILKRQMEGPPPPIFVSRRLYEWLLTKGATKQ